MIAVSLSNCGPGEDDPSGMHEEAESFPPALRRNTTPVPEPLRSFCIRSDRTQLSGPQTDGTPIQFRRVLKGRAAPPEPLRCVVRNWDEWERLRTWGQMERFDSVTPELFTDSMLLFASMGKEPTNAYSTTVQSVHALEGKLRVLVWSSQVGGISTMEIAYPFDLVQVRKSDAEVRFLER